MNNKTSFEKQIKRLEDILDKLNTQLPLEESIKLYEEADTLLTQCQSALKSAESKIEQLLAKRNGQGEIEAIETEQFDIDQL